MEDSAEEALSSADVTDRNATDDNADHRRGSSTSLTSLSDGLNPTSRPDGVIFGKLDSRTPDACIRRQYLLPLNSSAMRKFFGNKDCYIDAANEAASELEFSRQIATLKNTEWPRYQLIEIRSATEESLKRFERELLVLNPAFKERLPHDPEKYACAQPTRRLSGHSAVSETTGSVSTEDDISEDAGAVNGKEDMAKRQTKRLSKEPTGEKAAETKEKSAAKKH